MILIFLREKNSRKNVKTTITVLAKVEILVKREVLILKGQKGGKVSKI